MTLESTDMSKCQRVDLCRLLMNGRGQSLLRERTSRPRATRTTVLHSLCPAVLSSCVDISETEELIKEIVKVQFENI